MPAAVRPDPAAEACTCELCRALLALAESAVRNRAAAEAQRARMRVVPARGEEDHGEDR